MDVLESTEKDVKKFRLGGKRAEERLLLARRAAKIKKPLVKSVSLPHRGVQNQWFMKPMQPSPALAQVIGSEPMPRTLINQKLWKYIKQNDLQDPHDGRIIHPDVPLLAVLQKPKVTMFELVQLTNLHLVAVAD